jgi:hypothetical protein
MDTRLSVSANLKILTRRAPSRSKRKKSRLRMMAIQFGCFSLAIILQEQSLDKQGGRKPDRERGRLSKNQRAHLKTIDRLDAAEFDCDLLSGQLSLQ